MAQGTSKSLLGRVVLLIGLSLFTVELAVLAVFTAFAYGERVADRHDKLDRFATQIREGVRAAVLHSRPDDAEIDAELREAMERGERAHSAPPASHVAATDFPVEVWVFVDGEARSYRGGSLAPPSRRRGPAPGPRGSAS